MLPGHLKKETFAGPRPSLVVGTKTTMLRTRAFPKKGANLSVAISIERERRHSPLPFFNGDRPFIGRLKNGMLQYVTGAFTFLPLDEVFQVLEAHRFTSIRTTRLPDDRTRSTSVLPFEPSLLGTFTEYHAS